MPTLDKLRDRVRWVDVPGYPGVRAALKTTHDPNYRRALMEGMMPHLNTLRDGGIVGPEVTDPINNLAVAEHLLEDWKGIEDGKGDPLPFSRELAVKLSLDPSFGGFFRSLQEKADELAGRKR